GSLSDIQIVRGVDPSLDKEAVRLIGSMPAWIPGTQRGNKVRVKYTLPVTFRLSGKAPTVEANKAAQEKLNDAVIEIGSSDGTFVVVEVQPEFPGGNVAMMNFIAENIRYPKEAHEKGIQGRVITNFIVRKDGSIDSVQIVRGVDPLLDAEAIRVLESMPTWKPGKQRGQPISVRYTLPVIFRLNKNTENAIQKTKLHRETGRQALHKRDEDNRW
ncbi:MAG: energy transducer TonB, partial [Petrimonas sp.]|nr:energy transducer TonB [Petrimonas sp.]MEA4978598.1 energy transducer TonB [Petrimonas sp.]